MPFQKINTVEQADHELIFIYPKEKDGITITPTGDSETTHIEGWWNLMADMARSTMEAHKKITPPSSPEDEGYDTIKRDPDTLKVKSWHGTRTTITLTRKPGWLCDMTVRMEPVIFSYDDDEDNDSEDGDGDDDSDTCGDAGTSRERPVLEYDFAMVEQPILTHPMFDGASKDELAALKLYMEGASPKELVRTQSGTPPYAKLADLLAQIPEEKMQRVRRTPQYLSITISLTSSYKVARSMAYPEFPESCTIQTPPRAKTPRGRNWLYIGGTVKPGARECEVVEKYLLSGPDGWDEELYGPKAQSGNNNTQS